MKSALLLSILPLIAVSPPQDDELRLRPKKASVPAVPVVLEMKMRGVMPAVEVMVNGEGPFLFAIDSGGQGAARVDTTLLEKLGLEVVDEIMGSDGSGTGGTPMKVVELESLEVGGARFEGVRALSRDYNRSPRLPHIDGMLGYHLFDDHVLTLAYADKAVIVQRGPYEFPEGAATTAITSERDDIPRVTAELAGHEMKGVAIDTGKMGGIGIPPALVDQLTFLEEPRVVGRGRTVSGEFEVKAARVEGRFTLGDAFADDPRVDMIDAFDMSIVGSTFLAPYRITFAPGQKAVWVRTPEHEDELRAAEKEGDDG